INLSEGLSSTRIQDRTAGAKTRIEETQLMQAIECQPVLGKMFGLSPHRRAPTDSEPSEILVNRQLILTPAAPEVDILNAQQESAVGATRQIQVQQGRISMAQVEVAIGRRCKTKHRLRGASRHYSIR